MPEINFSPLSQCLQETTNSYKYFWFLALIDEAKESCLSRDYREGSTHFARLPRMAARLISRAWYPTTQGLRYGQQDKIGRDVLELGETLRLRPAEPIGVIQDAIEKHFSEGGRSHILRYVPYRFLTPWLAQELDCLTGDDGKKNAYIKSLADSRYCHPSEPVPYRFSEDKIQFHPDWLLYLFANQLYLTSFVRYMLIKRLERHNPKAVQIATKLDPPTVRGLEPAKRLWRLYRERLGRVACVYSGQILSTLSMDHIVPWTMDARDRIWNIVPTTRGLNSSKGASAPSLDIYGEEITQIHWNLFEFFLASRDSTRDSDCERHEMDYRHLFDDSVDSLSRVSEHKFRSVLLGQLSREIALARHSGIRTNWRVSS